jgi:hypothetical protein
VVPNPYHVIFFSPDGAKRESESIIYTPVLITESLKEEWRREMQRPQLATTRRARGEPRFEFMALPFREPDV